VVVAPIVDTPPDSSAAAVFPDLTELQVSVAHAGSSTDLVSATFKRGEAIELTNVPFADDLVMHMTGLTGAAVVAYGRTCAFSVAAGQPPPSPHLFFSRQVYWAEDTAPAPSARLGGTAVTYHDGSGIWLGGVDASAAPVTQLDRFDPSDGTFAALDVAASRRDATVGALPDGRLVIMGGIDTATGLGAEYLELVEADNNLGRRVQQLPQIHLARVGMTATTTTSDLHPLIVIGGLAGATTSGEVDEVSTDASGVLVKVKAPQAVPRSAHTATRLGEDDGAPILVVGGVDGGGAPVGVAELYKPLTGKFTSPAVFAPTMKFPRSHHVAARLTDGSVLIVGGVDAQGKVVRELEQFSLDAGFVSVGTLPDDAGVIDVAVVPLRSGTVLLAGGRTAIGGPPVSTAYQALLSDGTFVLAGTAPLAVPRAGAQGALLCDGTVLLSGGTTTATPAERYNPAPEKRR
jgi:hypothetical protein